MKIILCLFIMAVSGGIGISFKISIKKKLAFFNLLNDFAEFAKQNISLFKNNLVQIIDEFILKENEKNAKYLQIFQKNGQIYTFDRDLVLKYSGNEADADMILRFLSELGKNEYDFERIRLDEFLSILKSKTNKEKEELSSKGSLAFKVSLAIGAVLSIIIW